MHPVKRPSARPGLALLVPTLVALALVTMPPAGPPVTAAGVPDAPAACGGIDPYLVASRFTPHLSGGDRGREGALVAFRAGDAAVTALASQADLGATFGLAYDPARGHLYAAAYHKRGTDFGPGGPGAIYRVDVATGVVTRFASLPAGPDRHDLRNNDDEPAARWVGLASLGGMALDDAGSTLYAVNLLDRRIYRLTVPDGRAVGSFPAGGTEEAWGRDARPLALAWREGWLYQGVVNIAAEAGTAVPVGYVYRSRPNGGDMSQVARFPMAFAKNWPWGYWDDGFPFGRSQPMIASLAFRPSGDLLIGVRDRVLDGGWPPTYQAGQAGGDVLAGAWNGDRFTVATLNRGGYTPWGALTVLPGLDWSALTHRAAGAGQDGAVTWFAEDAGRALTGRVVSPLPAGNAVEPTWSLGGLAVLCDPRATPAPDLPVTVTAELTRAAASAAAAASATRAEQTAAATRLAPTQTAAAQTQAPTWTAAAATQRAQQTIIAATSAPMYTRMAATQRALATEQMRTRVAVYKTIAPTRTAAAVATLTARPRAQTMAAPTLRALGTAAAATGTRAAPLTQTPAAATWRTLVDACAGDNPYYVTTQFERLRSAPPYAGQTPAIPPPEEYTEGPALLAFNDTEPEQASLHPFLAAHSQVGAVFGLAVDYRRAQLFAGAFNKRGTLFGPGGPGAIYRLDLATGALGTFAVLPAGDDWHLLADTYDETAADWVGKMSLGDIELSEDGSTLFAMNLYDRRIWRLAVPGGAVLGSFAHGGSGEPWAANARPFGLGVRDGWLYHGVVDSRADETQPGELAAYVYRSRPDGSQMREVLRLALDYPRPFPWRAWPPIPPAAFEGGGGNFVDAEPMLTDLEFRPNGDLLLGFRSRLGDAATGNAADGDLLPTVRQDATTWLAVTQPEHYADRIIHDESTWGTLAAVPGLLDQVVSTAIDPWVPWSGGHLWYDNPTGTFVRRETIYVGAPMQVRRSFGKTAGLGDVEPLCLPELAPPTLTPTATPSAVPTGTSSPTASATASPSPTATPTPRPIYIPTILREACETRVQRADVVLVLDISTSMERNTRLGRQKLAAVQDAARVFTTRMDFVPAASGKLDQLAIAGFNDTAWIQQPLTSDRPLVDAAITALPLRLAEGTRLDLAIQIGRQALADPRRRADNTPVMVLLTDGLPNRVPIAEDGRMETTVLRLADAAKAAGIRLYTIGVGQSGDYNATLLSAIASRPEMFYETTDAEDLARIYAEIAFTIGCPPGRHDWGKPWP